MMPKRNRVLFEKIIESSLFLCSFISVIITAAIFIILMTESIPFFKKINLKDIFFSTQWSPLFEKPQYGIWALISGTLMTTVVALFAALPIAIIIAIFLSEFTNARLRNILKPIVELLAAIPTVVYGYFALLIVTPFLKKIFPEISTFNALSAGLTIGMMIIPYISSLSEDALQAVPNHLREASLSMGASRFQTSFFIVLPAAFSGVISALVLGISRAIGETMIVAIAAGLEPKFSFNVFESTETLTAFIVQVSQGDLPHGSIGYQTIYVCGLMLFIFTLILNSLALFIKNKYHQNTRSGQV